MTAQAQDGQETSVSNNMTLEGTSSFGNLLTNTVNESQTPEADANYDGRICDLVIEDTTAVVEFTTPVDANLVVAIYDQDNGKMLGSGTVAVGPEETIAEVALEIPAMPRYFRAGAYLLDAATNDPVSEEFKTDHYTKTMQDILAATVDDFNPELVLNLDNSPETNFAVFNEQTPRAEANTDSNIITDNGGGTYTITNADEGFLSMQPGETFTYTYPDDTMLIVNAASVRVNGTTVTVTENPDADLSTVFDFVKIEGDSSGKNYDHDATGLGEAGVTVISDEEFAKDMDVSSSRAISIDNKGSIGTNFSISHTIAGNCANNVTINGKVAFGLTVNLKVYLSRSYQYVAFSCDYSLSGNIGITGKVTMCQLPMGNYDVYICAGVYAHVNPKFVVEASGSLSYTIKWTGSFGLAYDSDLGRWTDISSPPSVKSKVEFSGKLLIGIKSKLGIAVIHEKTLDLSAEGIVGFEVWGAFQACSSLTSITLPKGITTLRFRIFFLCENLTSITIPDSIATVEQEAFSCCTSLRDVYYTGAEDQWNHVYIEWDNERLKNATLHCNSTGAGDVEDSSKCGENLTWTLDNNGLLTISGSGKMIDTVNPYPTFPWYTMKQAITAVVVEKGVTSIGTTAFAQCEHLASVTISDSVTHIGQGAFIRCSNLRDVYYPGTVEQWKQITVGDLNDTLTDATIHCTDGDIGPSPLPQESAYSLRPATEVPTEVPTEAPTEATEVTVPDATEELLPEIIEEPKETEPAPQSEEELLLEEVSDIQWYSAPAGARMTVEPVLQKLSAFSGTESVRSGVRSVKFTGLEPGEEYVLFVSLIPGSLVPQNLLYIDQDNAGPDGTLSFTYIPRQDVSTHVQLYGIPAGRTVTLDREHLTMEVGANPVQLTARVTPEEWAGDIKWSAENPENTKVISVNASGDVTPIAPGIAYAVATVTHGRYTFSARCRVDVTEQSVADMISGVQLGATAVTTELFRTDYAEFDVIFQLPQNMNPVMTSYALRSRSMVSNFGVAIDSAAFADEKTASFFDLIVKDDRTLRVVPKQSAIDNPKSVAGSYTSKVKVFVDGQEFVTDTALKLSVKKSMPKLKVSALTFNPFYTGQSQAIRITGATVTNITFTENKTQPNWVKLENGILTLTKDAPARASGRVYLTVDTAEWAVRTNLTVSVKNTYAAPKLKLSASTITLPTFANPDDNGYYAGGQRLRLLCAAKGNSLERLNVDKIEAPSGWYSKEGEDGWFWLQPNAGKQISAGKITLKVHFSNTESVVPLTLKVKTKNTPIMIITPDYLHSVKLNSRIEDGFFLGNLTSNAWLNWEQYDLDLKILDKYGNNVVGSMFYVSDDLDYICTLPGITKAGTYRMTLDLRNKETGMIRTEKSSVVTITVLPASTKPSVSVKALDAIDYTFSDNPRTRLQLTFKNFQIRRITHMYYSVTLGKNDMTDRFDLYFDDSVWSWVLKPNVEVPTGSYTLKLGACMDEQNPEEVTRSCSVKITVKRTPVKLKLSKTSLSLNKKIGDTAVVDVTCQTKGYDFKQPIAQLILPGSKDGQNIHLNGPGSQEPLTFSWSGGKLTVTANTTAETGKTYKVVLKATEKDPAVTLSVKILDTAVTASLKAKGAIDVVRSSTTITVSPSYRNYMGLADISPELTIESWSGKKGEDYLAVAENLFDVQFANGSFTIKKVPGANVDTTLKYRAKLTFKGGAKPAYVNLSIKSGTAKVSVSGTPVLYKADRYSRGAFRLTTTGKTLNPIVKAEIKDAKYQNLFAIYSYGNGEFAIGFKDNLVPTVRFPSSVVLNVYADGNSTRSVASVTLKLQVR